MTNYAEIDSRSAFLATEFGEELARKWFGDESVDSLPCYTRGPRKGKIKGAITWSKVCRGGWVRGAGYVENRVGMIFDRKLHNIVSDRFGTSIGRTIRDLDEEISHEKYLKSINKSVDVDIRKLEMDQTRIEQVILSGKFDEHIEVFQYLISDLNVKIAALIAQIK